MATSSFATFDVVASHASHPDTALLPLIQQGNDQVLDDLYRTHRVLFIKWAEKQFGLSYHQAVDVYQDAIIILYENICIGKLNTLRASLKTYLFAIGKNLVLTLLRRQQREQESYKYWEHERQEMDLFDPTQTTVDWQQLLGESIAASMSSLPKRAQTFIELFYFKKMPLKQITLLLGYKNEDVAKSTKARYLSSLREVVRQKVAEQLV